MTEKIKLSILDIGNKLQGEDAVKTLKDAMERVKLAEELGYSRYWFAEHHNTKNQVSTSPDLMMAHAASVTNHIEVGAGGIMLPNHSPLKVAENFSLLEAFHPGRVNLGIGRAPGTDNLTALALRRSKEAVLAYNFDEEFAQLLSYFTGNFPSGHPYKDIEPIPKENSQDLIPEIYMLGSSNGGVQYAVTEGLGFVFASHINPDLATQVLRGYHKNFKPSEFMAEPKGIYSGIIITAETDEEAEYLAGPVQLFWARMYTGNIKSPFPTAEEAKNHRYTANENMAKIQNRSRFIIGGVDAVSEKLKHLAEESMVNEIMMMEFYPDKESSHKAYRLLAEKFKLKN